MPEVGGLGTGVRLTEEPLMSMEAEVRDDKGVSIVEGIADTGGEFEDPLPVTHSILYEHWHNITHFHICYDNPLPDPSP